MLWLDSVVMVRSSFDAYYVLVWINQTSIRYPIEPVCDDDAMEKFVMSTYDLRDPTSQNSLKKKQFYDAETVVKYVLVMKLNEMRADDNDTPLHNLRIDLKQMIVLEKILRNESTPNRK